MKALVTANFNNTMQTLSKSAQNDVFNIFNKISRMSRKDLENSRSFEKVRQLADGARPMYVYKESAMRVFLALDNDNVIFLDLATSPEQLDRTILSKNLRR